jgi:hypothetical protein
VRVQHCEPSKPEQAARRIADAPSESHENFEDGANRPAMRHCARAARRRGIGITREFAIDAPHHHSLDADLACAWLRACVHSASLSISTL